MGGRGEGHCLTATELDLDLTATTEFEYFLSEFEFYALFTVSNHDALREGLITTLTKSMLHSVSARVITAAEHGILSQTELPQFVKSCEGAKVEFGYRPCFRYLCDALSFSDSYFGCLN